MKSLSFQSIVQWYLSVDWHELTFKLPTRNEVARLGAPNARRRPSGVRPAAERLDSEPCEPGDVVVAGSFLGEESYLRCGALLFMTKEYD